MTRTPTSMISTHTYEGFNIAGKCIHGNDFELHKTAEILESRMITRVILDLYYDYHIDDSIGDEPTTDTSDRHTAEMNFRFILASTPSNHSWEQLKHSTMRLGKNNLARFVAIGKDIQRVWLNFTLFSRRQSVRLYDIEARVTSYPRPDPEYAKALILADPIFASRSFQPRENTCFVLMPFTDDWSDRVWRHVRTIVEDTGLQCLRADNLFGPNILDDIWRAINESTLIIADTTARNPNVFYEIGVAHTLGKRVILLSQSDHDIPFDFRGYRHLVYQDNVDGFEKLSEQLPLFVSDALNSAR